MDTRAQKLWQRGMVHFRQGNMEAAQANFEAFLAREPGSGPGHFRLSLVDARRKRFVPAIAHARIALDIDPDRVEVLAHLARCHLGAGQPERARTLAMQALALPRDNPVVLDSLAVVMTRLDEQALALDLFDRAIELGAGQASIHFNRALARKQFGLLDGAEQDLEACLALLPGHAKAHWALATLRTQDLAGNHVGRLRRQLAVAPPENEELLAVSLFKELDDLAETGEAGRTLARATAARVRRPATAPAAIVDALIRSCDDRFVRRPAGARTENGPVFVIGMPRSGVGLLGSILSRHPRFHHLGIQAPFEKRLAAALGNDAPRAPTAIDIETAARNVDFAALGRDYLAEVAPAGVRQALVCESHPANYLYAGFIARALPGARLLHLVREPVDNCVSILGHPGSDLPAGDPAALAEHYLQHLRLMQHWHDVLPGRIIEVSYESLVEKPEMMLRVVCSFLGIRYASALRMGLQLHPRSVGRGRRYLPGLPALEAGLASLARKSRSA